MTGRKPHIALLLMCKNEERRIHVTLESVKDYVDSFVVFDTGSTDKTLEKIKEHSESFGIPLRLIEGEFVDFSTSRNVSIQFAETFEDIDYLLLLDTNDELRNGKALREFALEEMKNDEITGYLVCQEWWSGQYDKYYNMRFIKNRRSWRYKGRVHEWMCDLSKKEGEKDKVKRLPDDIVLFQDRTQDNNKSGARFARDKILLLEDHMENPSEPRTTFYLAQTCSCLSELEDSYYYYKLRSTQEGFQEEKFHAYFRCGELSYTLGHDWSESLAWFMKAYEHSLRAEPLVKIAEYYRRKEKWFQAYMFAENACRLQYPTASILFVNKMAYDYERWHLLGIIGWYAGFYADGKIGCLKAIEAKNAQIDKDNLQFYLDREKREGIAVSNGGIQTNAAETKKSFIDRTVKELAEKNPKLSAKKLNSMATAMWKAKRN